MSDNPIIFGPVPSRRLGQSLGINNIPPKICTYSCVYCQIGRKTKIQTERIPFYNPADILDAVREKIRITSDSGGTVNYLTFVPDGEPTLDVNLEEEIDLLKPLGFPVAVITNASLIWDADVRNALKKADLVSMKVDTVSEEIWRKIQRPHKSLVFGRILDGIIEFSGMYRGRLITETMLISGINDTAEQIKNLALYLVKVMPAVAYIAVPTRPPAENWVKSPDENTINMAYQMIDDNVNHVELLTGFEGNAFSFTGNAVEDLLNITSVHPMREDSLRDFLERAEKDWTVIEKLIKSGNLAETEYEGKKFYLRRFLK